MREITLKRNTPQGAFLAIKRLEKGISIEKLAETLKVSGSTVHRWEVDGNIPGFGISAQLADLLGITLDELLRPSQPAPAPAPEPASPRRKRKPHNG